ncbi:sulfotransferase [Pannus brasiliensis CCIBt3594]|uniref:Sulfotransferase n=1 Tax=Pannus brasiliensis CCIBt3594 TaxID=1427578 RepID=A0AAW9QYR3_9CHRO
MHRKATIALSLLQSLPRSFRHFHQYPPIFIIGAPRSGTSITLKLFQDQPLTTVLFEPFQLWQKVFRSSDDDSYRSSYHRPGSWILKSLYYQQILVDKPYLVVKDPRDSLRVNRLNRLFPDARFIHVIRDGRDVIASMMKTFQNEVYLTLEDRWPHVRIPGYRRMLSNPPHINAAHQWKICVETSLQDFSSIPPERQFHFQYEDLVRKPEEVAPRILQFAYPRLEFDRQRLQTIVDSISDRVIQNVPESTDNSIPNQSSWKDKMKRFSSLVKDDAGSGTTASERRVNRWQTDLDDKMISECREIVGDTLQKLGYEE